MVRKELAAGLAAAVSACENGAEDVVLIERDDFLGGILGQCIHNGFGLHLFGEDLTGPEYAQRFIERLSSLPVRRLTHTMVVEMDAERNMVAASQKHGLLHLRPRAVVLAMGCRERTRGAIGLPGSRPAGIMTAGAAQRFINIEGILPGREIVILGSGDIGMIMARRLSLEGCAVKAVVEIQSSIGGLTRNLVQCLQDFDIPLFLSHTIADIHGQERVERVDVAPVNSAGEPDLSRTFSIDCDTLLLSVGLIPENELSKQAGIELDPLTGGPIVDQYFQTTVPGIFAAGNVVQVFDLVDHVSACGTEAGRAAAMYAQDATFGEEVATLRPGDGIRYVVPQRIRGGWDGEMSFYMRAVDVRRRTTLQLLDQGGDILFEKRLRIVRPPEMIKVGLGSPRPRFSGQLTFQLGGGTP